MVTKKLSTQKAKKRAPAGRKKPSGKKKKKGKKTSRRISPWWVVGILLAVLLFTLVPYLRSGRFATSGAAVPPNAHAFCVDLSHHNAGDIAWDSLRVVVDKQGRTSKDIVKARKIYPVTTVVLKATEGETMTDNQFAKYWEEAGERELVRGAYHFYRSSKDPAVQARNYISQVRLRHSDLPPILDVETLHRGGSAETLSRDVLVWLRTVEEHYGRTPIVYTSDSFARDVLSPSITRSYPMWIARYNEEPPLFGDWTMWQFTDKAVLYGISGYVDLSVIK